MSKPSTAKIKSFRKKMYDMLETELKIREDIKNMYAQFCLDVGDDEIGLRHVRQAFFQIQKHRVHKLLEERLEFHPFFGAHFRSSADFNALDVDEGDDVFEEGE